MVNQQINEKNRSKRDNLADMIARMEIHSRYFVRLAEYSVALNTVAPYMRRFYSYPAENTQELLNSEITERIKTDKRTHTESE